MVVVASKFYLAEQQENRYNVHRMCYGAGGSGMYSDVFCKVYNEFGWNYYPEIFGQQLLQWLKQENLQPQTALDLACGTGTGSTAAALWASGKLPGGYLKAENRGGMLSVTVEGENGVITSLLLEGPTEITKIYEK